ncbi:MAG: hypothetical protein M1167_02930, partial [Chloroflexi bacterium]|nr:hypothetical protein [Chloroflexota bacterium]
LGCKYQMYAETYRGIELCGETVRIAQAKAIRKEVWFGCPKHLTVSPFIGGGGLCESNNLRSTGQSVLLAEPATTKQQPPKAANTKTERGTQARWLLCIGFFGNNYY